MVVLAELTDNFSMRREIMKEDWVSRVIVAMGNLQKLTHEIMIKVGWKETPPHHQQDHLQEQSAARPALLSHNDFLNIETLLTDMPGPPRTPPTPSCFIHNFRPNPRRTTEKRKIW